MRTLKRVACRLPILAFAVVISGCASSGAVLIGADTYLMRKEGGLGTFGLSAPLAADLRNDSAAFCLKTGRVPETIKESTLAGMPPLQSASAELRFRCVPG